MLLVNVTLAEANSVASDQFIKIFGNVVEHFPAAAIGILKERPFEDKGKISEAVGQYLDELGENDKRKILELHPDLAGRLLESGKLTPESTEEQRSAGLDHIAEEDKQTLQTLNEEYKRKFKFPFVVCARDNGVETILEAISSRLENPEELELSLAIEEVKKIAHHRIMQTIIE